jgi:hypothetical protein
MSFNNTGYVYTRLTPAKGSVLDPIEGSDLHKSFQKYPIPRPEGMFKSWYQTNTGQKLTLGQSKP